MKFKEMDTQNDINSTTTTNLKYERFKELNWWQRNYLEILIFIAGLIIINLIFLAKAFRGNQIDAEKASWLGAFISGYIGTFFVLVSVVFLYRTLKEQRQSSNIEKFENKYFELLRLHRDNVAEIGIGGSSGKKSFVILIREFRAILSIVVKLSKANEDAINRQKDLLAITYLILFYGIGFNSTRMLKNSLKDLSRDFIDKLVQELSNHETTEEAKKQFNLSFTPFEGHQSRLGHYYRHLYQTVRFVDDKKDIHIDKYSYVKTVRAQLTNHEQALLFINSLSPLGKNWWNNDLMVRYRLVKNIPEGFFDVDNEVDITEEFPNDYFEWQKKS